MVARILKWVLRVGLLLSVVHLILQSLVVQQLSSPIPINSIVNATAAVSNRTGDPIVITEQAIQCVTPECIRQVALKLRRVWTPKTWDHWCSHGGLVLVKVPKSASSTVAGAALRVGNHHNCRVEWKHGRLEEKFINSTSFLVAPVRDPGSRALSSYYFHHVSFHGGLRRERSVVENLKEVQRDFVLNYTAPRAASAVPRSVLRTVQDTMEAYDCLIVVERMVDSLVVLSWITGIDIERFLTLSTKQGGSYYNSGNRCIRLVKAEPMNASTALFRSSSWHQWHYGDYLLHAVAEASLDATIEQIGRPMFEAKAARFRRLQKMIDEHCSREAVFPCSSNGTLQLERAKESCYARDFGCGHACVDRVLELEREQ